MYIIDANNLAFAIAKQSSLVDTGRRDFDRQLITLLRDFLGIRSTRAVLVFDGYDVMGDRYASDNITVEYVPKDSYYKCADDKIIELAREYGKKESVIVVTDDNEIKDKVKKISQDIFKSIDLIQSTDLAVKVIRYFEETHRPSTREDEKDLDEDDEEMINGELMKIWK